MSLLQTITSWISRPGSGTVKQARSLSDTNEHLLKLAFSAPWKVESGSASDPGCVRELNEDAVFLNVPSSEDGLRRHGVLALVCDGMGGHEAGEVASALARDTIIAELTTKNFDLPEALIRSVEKANQMIYESGHKRQELRGMGTTCCALVIRDGYAWCAHVGDSRCYLLRNSDLLLMTEDHSTVMDMVKRGIISLEEARHHPEKNVISRALGSRSEVEVSSWNRPLAVQAEDAFLLCSDGLYDLVSDEDIRLIMTSGSPHAQTACDRLITLARERGGLDNISAVMVHLRATSNASKPIATTNSIEIVS